jgi:hypothetical protein
MSKACTVGKSCGSACISRAKECEKDLDPRLIGFLEKVQMEQKEAIKRKREEREANIEKVRIKLREDFFNPKDSEEDLPETEVEWRKRTISRWLESGTISERITPEERELFEDVVMTGQMLGAGASGSVYAKGEVAVKIGSIMLDEVENTRQMAKLGFAPKVIAHIPTEEGSMRGILIQERVPGVALHRLTRVPLDTEFKAKIVENAFFLQDQLNKAGVAHRDVHSGNMMVGPDGSVRMVDWAFSVRDQKASNYEFDSADTSFAGLVLDTIMNGRAEMSEALSIVHPSVRTNLSRFGDWDFDGEEE